MNGSTRIGNALKKHRNWEIEKVEAADIYKGLAIAGRVGWVIWLPNETIELEATIQESIELIEDLSILLGEDEIRASTLKSNDLLDTWMDNQIEHFTPLLFSL